MSDGVDLDKTFELMSEAQKILDARGLSTTAAYLDQAINHLVKHRADADLHSGGVVHDLRQVVLAQSDQTRSTHLRVAK